MLDIEGGQICLLMAGFILLDCLSHFPLVSLTNADGLEQELNALSEGAILYTLMAFKETDPSELRALKDLSPSL